MGHSRLKNSVDLMSVKQIAEKENFQKCHFGFPGIHFIKVKPNTSLIKSGLILFWLLTGIFSWASSTGIAMADDVKWAPEGAKWYYKHYDGTSNKLTIIESVGDTVVKGNTVRQLNTSLTKAKMQPDGSFNYETKVIDIDFLYFKNDTIFHFDRYIKQFYPLYLFNTEPEDTVFVREPTANDCNGGSTHPFYCLTFEYKVDSIKTSNSGTIEFNKIYTSPTNQSEWSYRDVVFEFIGSLKYFFGKPDFPVFHISHLACYEDEFLFYRFEKGKVLFENNDDLACKDIKEKYSSVSPEIQIREFNVYPNPVDDFLIVQSNKSNSINNVNIYSIDGKELNFQTKIRQEQITIKTDAFAHGLYFLIIEFENGQKAYRKIQIN